MDFCRQGGNIKTKAAFLKTEVFGKAVTVKLFRIVLVCALFNTGLVFPQETMTFFDEKFALNVMGNYNIGLFTRDETLSFKTEEPFRIGVGLRYKKISAQLYIPLSFNFNSFDLEFNSYLEKMYIESFLKHYRSFYHNDDEGHTNTGLDTMASGITIGWIHSNQKHSLSSVYNLDRKQNRAGGSFLYGCGIFYTSIYDENNDIERYSERKHLLHFGPTAGYSYTWILPHTMFINIGIHIGTNLGISVTDHTILCIPQIKPKISIGHHNHTWSLNAVMACNSTIILWDTTDPDIMAPSTMTITFSKRF